MNIEEAVNFLSSKIGELKKDADKIFDTPEGEEALYQFIILKKAVDEAEKEIKVRIKERAEALDPNFTALRSDRVSVNYSYYGARYKLVDPSKAPEELLKPTLDSDKLEHYLEEMPLPEGIEEVERTKSASWRLNKVK